MHQIYLAILIIPIILILSYIVVNLYRKNRVYENWIVDIKEGVNELNKNINEVDSKDVFEKDDEVGVVFEQIKELINSFNKKVQD